MMWEDEMEDYEGRRQEEIRRRLNRYIIDEGVTAKYIAQQIGMDESKLSRFRSGKIELYPETLSLIGRFLEVRPFE